ncbi:MAG: hypothetical protein RL189_1043 [Pseudomonadota bacterium]|jgi:O-antigen/teichoic acid export membrane protein
MAIRIKPQLKELSLTLAGVALNAVLGLLTIKVLSNTLDKDNYSGYVLATTVTSFCMLIVFGPLTNSIARYFAEANTNGQLHDLRQTINSIFLKIVSSILFATIFILLIAWLYNNNPATTESAVIYGLILSIPTGICAIQEALYSTNRMRGQVIKLQLGNNALKILGIVIIIQLFEPSDSLVLLTIAVSTLLVSWINWRIQEDLIFKRYEYHNTAADRKCTAKEWQKLLLTYAIPFSIWSIPQWLQQAADKWTLQSAGDATAVAELAILTTVFATPINLVSSALQQFISPILFQRMADKSNDTNFQNFRSVILLCALLTGFCIPLILLSHFYSSKLITFFSNEAYTTQGSWGVSIALAYFLQSLGQILCLPLLGEGKLGSLTKLKISTGILGAIFSIFGAAYYALAGAIFAQFAFGLMFLIGSLVLQFEQVIRLCKLNRIAQR